MIVLVCEVEGSGKGRYCTMCSSRCKARLRVSQCIFIVRTLGVFVGFFLGINRGKAPQGIHHSRRDRKTK